MVHDSAGLLKRCCVNGESIGWVWRHEGHGGGGGRSVHEGVVVVWAARLLAG